MKKCIIATTLLFIVIILSSCLHSSHESSSSSFELSGKLDGGGEGMYIYLDRLAPDGIIHLDSTKIGKEGIFSFRTVGIIKGFYNIRLTHDNFATLILDSNEKVNLKGSSENLGYTWTVTGSPDSRAFKTLNDEAMEYKTALDSLQSSAQTFATALGGNQRRLDSLNLALESPFDSIRTLHQRYIIKFIKNDLTSFSALAAIQQLSPDDYLSYYILLDSALTDKYPTSIYSKHFHDEVVSFRRTAVGAPAPELRLPNINGKVVGLDDFKGKTVLIHFWSSASRSSIASLTSITKICRKVEKDNFAVLGVSFDRDKDSWLNAIKQYKLNCTNVCDTMAGNSKLFQLYNISSLPYDIIISAEGKIVDKDIPPEDLDYEISRALKLPSEK